MRHDPDIVAICHVAMSSPTSEHRQRVIQRFEVSQRKSIRITSGFSDSVSTLRCFLWIWFQSIFLYYHLPPTSPQPFSLCSPSLTRAPACRLWGLGFTILSPTLIQSLIRRGLPYTSSSPFVLSPSSPSTPSKTLFSATVILFLMFLMCITRHPGGLFIFPFSGFRASSPSPLLCFYMLSMLSTCLKTDAASLIEIQPCRVDLIDLEPPIYNMFLTYSASMFHINCILCM